jgi:hypothetical protein
VGRGYHDQFGTAVANAGDVNGDGFSDVGVGNLKNDDTGGGASGSVDLFLGSRQFDNVADATLRGTVPNDSFGTHITGVGDVNGDGYGDLLVGASSSRPGGMAYLFFGATGAVFDHSPDATFVGAVENSLGATVSSAGDVNGDGISDVAIGAYGHAAYAGRVDIFLGAAGLSFDNNADSTLTGAGSDYFGLGLAFSSAKDFVRYARGRFPLAATLQSSVSRLL